MFEKVASASRAPFSADPEHDLAALARHHRALECTARLGKREHRIYGRPNGAVVDERGRTGSSAGLVKRADEICVQPDDAVESARSFDGQDFVERCLSPRQEGCESGEAMSDVDRLEEAKLLYERAVSAGTAARSGWLSHAAPSRPSILRMEPLWSPAVATAGNQWQID